MPNDDLDLTAVAGQLILEDAPALSKLERLPTELVQKIASYLICACESSSEGITNNDHINIIPIAGLRALRVTSHTMRAKIEYTFTRCFKSVIVECTEKSALSLFHLAKDERLGSRVRHLEFVGPAYSTPSTAAAQALYPKRLASAMATEEMQAMMTKIDHLTTALLAAAMNVLTMKSICIAPSLSKWYLTEAPRDLTLFHPSSIVLTAFVLARPWLDEFHLDTGEWGTYYGMHTYIFRSIVSRPITYLEDLRCLTLGLAYGSSRDTLDPRFEGLGDFLDRCWNLESLDFSLDKRTMERKWQGAMNSCPLGWMLKTTFWKLSTVSFTGLCLNAQLLGVFLANHKPTLAKLRLDNCDLDLSLAAVLEELQEFPGLQSLDLYQVSQARRRVLWRRLCIAELWAEENSDWLYIGYFGRRDIGCDGENIVAELIAAVECMSVTSKLADPFALDALRWTQHFCPSM